jgi:ATP-binding cassette subfamily F protein 3
MLHIKDITYRVGGRTLFEGASAHVPVGAKVGLVGQNGSGKTTLLRLITGELELSGGAIDLRARAAVGTVSQEAPGGEISPLEAVLAADRERAALLAEAETATSPERIAWVHERLVDIDAHGAPARAAAILAGLGFDERARNAPLGSLSGGWRMRVALAAALLREPDLLLLDEPTNHLDLESTIWLESYLADYPHTLLLVSHDRDLLNRVAGRILHIEGARLSSYSGGYDDFARVRLARLAQEEARRAAQAEERERLGRFIERFRAKASKARQAQSRIKALERLVPVSVAARERTVRFGFPPPAARPSPLLKLDGCTVGYGPDRPVLRGLNLSIWAEDRIALLGANGNGKTTLARLITGGLAPSIGQVVRASRLVTGYFAQDRLEQLDTKLTALEQMRGAMPDDPPDKVRGWLGRFGFGQERAETPVAGLSGGERTRLALALMALARPNLMVLDEPTNHLDMESRDALVEGLNEFEGAVILVSHDRHLIEATTEQLWLVEDGACLAFFGDLDEYRGRLLSKRPGRRGADGPPPEGEDGQRVSRKDERRQAAEARARIAPLRRAAEQATERLEALVREKDGIENRLADPALWTADPAAAAPLAARLRRLESELPAAEEEWLAAHAALESEGE